MCVYQIFSFISDDIYSWPVTLAAACWPNKQLQKSAWESARPDNFIGYTRETELAESLWEANQSLLRGALWCGDGRHRSYVTQRPSGIYRYCHWTYSWGIEKTGLSTGGRWDCPKGYLEILWCRHRPKQFNLGATRFSQLYF